LTGYSIAEVAARMGKSRQSVSGWLNSEAARKEIIQRLNAAA
jgi:transcriptional regulator with XRE-family HTH domain